MTNKKMALDFVKFKFLSGSALKIIALLTMFIDHIAAFYLYGFEFANEPFLAVGSHSVTLYKLCRLIGRVAFPTYCFLITEGYIHTHNKRKYGVNLLCFALISEIPWNYVHSGRLFYSGQNVFFTLFLGFLAIYYYEKYNEDKKRQLLSLFLLFIISLFLSADYGSRGMAFILFIYIMREKKIPQAIIGSCFFSRPWAIMAAFVPINMYDGTRGFIRGKLAKYAFYAAYPVHILLLYFLKAKYLGY